MNTDNARDPNTGRLLPGHPGLPGAGRPAREREKAVLDAIRDAIPPEEIKANLRKALEIAIEQKSARGIIAVLEFAAGYAVGKPVQRVDVGKPDDGPPDWVQAILDRHQHRQELESEPDVLLVAGMTKALVSTEPG
jgi:hypothetical protein